MNNSAIEIFKSDDDKTQVQVVLEKATVANFASVQTEGGRDVEREIEYFNLDVIISVGYRIKSKRGTQYRFGKKRFCFM